MRTALPITLLLCALTCYGQQQGSGAGTQPQTGADRFKKKFATTLETVKKARKEFQDAKTSGVAADIVTAEFNFKRAIVLDPLPWAEYIADADLQSIRSFLSDAEQKRIDKQVGSGAGTSGTTSLVSKGSIPALLGLAVENGAATQDTSGTTITFRARPTSIINALVKQDYILSGPAGRINLIGGTNEIFIDKSDLWYRILDKASFAVSFDTSKGPSAGTFTAERSQLTSYSGHYDLINHRDPRDPKNQGLWEDLRAGVGPALAGALTDFWQAVVNIKDSQGRIELVAWVNETSTQLLAASSDAEIDNVFVRRAEVFRTIVNSHPDVVALIKSRVIPAANTYAASRVDLLGKVSKSLTLAFDYSNNRQVVTLGDTDAGMVALPAGVSNRLPDLGNFLVTASGRFLGKSEITANFSGTRFNGRRPGPDIGRWRDVQFGVQIDVPFPAIGEGKIDLSFSYLYLNLLEEPLGAKIMVNGVEVSRKGIINFGQAKVDFPIGSSGMHIPISLTFSNRTELIKESDVRGNIGITFDLDKLFSKKD